MCTTLYLLETGARKELLMLDIFAARARGSKKMQMMINGERVDAASGATMEVRNPATGDVVDRVPKADAEDTRRAIQAAAAAFPSWSKLPPQKRSDLLMEAAACVRANLSEVASLLTSE